MNKLFSKTEMNAIKNSIRKRKDSHIYDNLETPSKDEDIIELNNLYKAVLSIECNMNKSHQERTLK